MECPATLRTGTTGAVRPCEVCWAPLLGTDGARVFAAPDGYVPPGPGRVVLLRPPVAEEIVFALLSSGYAILVDRRQRDRR